MNAAMQSRAANAPAIPLVDLKAQYRTIKTEIDAAMQRVLDRADFVLGADVDAFEAEFAAFCGAAHAVSCGSGTEALHLGLKALGIGPGDEVIMPAMTFVATALAITMCGGRPVLVDVDPGTALIDPAAIERAITPETRAILPVHLFGQCADMAAINALARRHGLKVIEDAAQAHGALCNGARAGILGDVGCFSFYPGKNLGAYGDGGLVTTNDPAIAEKMKLLRNWGSRRKYHHEVMGTNSRLDTLHAAVLRVKLKYLDGWNAARRRHAALYDAALAPLNHIERTRYDAGSIYHLYVVRTDDRDAALAALNGAGLGAAIHYPFAVHEHTAYAWLGYAPGSFPVSESWARRCLSLPIYPELPDTAPARAAAALMRRGAP
jgi:dTDP-4-amino-4,6-dideoxygalactose transaminase